MPTPEEIAAQEAAKRAAQMEARVTQTQTTTAAPTGLGGAVAKGTQTTAAPAPTDKSEWHAPDGLGKTIENGNVNLREQDVGTIAAEYASQNSGIMRQAAAKGMQTANRRGLLNSSIAAGASQAEVLERAVPMAMQTAQQNAQQNLSYQEFRQTRRVEHDRFNYQKTLNQIDNRVKVQLAEMGFDVQKELAEMDIGWQRDLAKMNIRADAKQNAGTNLSAIQSTANQSIQNILLDANMPAAEKIKAIEGIKQNANKQGRQIETLYNIELPDIFK